ncbi:hypothetical protein GE09DRAFT_1209350 [Coniochaeta sp. 2T2.1]|nr:hypothetical protein GE09DRAFT_1209350 [Coniochaeta sp. 2T2.1]
MSVASKNLFDLLGNDIEDPDAVPKAPTKIVEKATTHTIKRNADGVAPASKAAGVADSQSGNASTNTRSRNDVEQPTRGGRGARVRGGRGARRPPTGDERHSRSIPGPGRAKDEQVGEQIAKADQKEAVTQDAAPVEEAPVEEEESREEEVLFAGAAGKAQRQRERKQKQFVELENRFIEAPARGGRGRGEGRGEGRGGRGGPRGAPRGGAPRGAPRGGAGGAAPVNPNDQSAFPSLGS